MSYSSFFCSCPFQFFLLLCAFEKYKYRIKCMPLWAYSYWRNDGSVWCFIYCIVSGVVLYKFEWILCPWRLYRSRLVKFTETQKSLGKNLYLPFRRYNKAELLKSLCRMSILSFDFYLILSRVRVEDRRSINHLLNH